MMDGSVEEVAVNNDVVVYGVDANGQYLGLVPQAQAHQVAHKPPPGDGYVWDGGWKKSVSLDQRKIAAYDLIDRHAGLARLRHITDVPGQAATYLRKAQEAVAFIAAGGTGPVPPYVQGEATAAGVTPLEAANNIAFLSNLWGEVIGPQIELARRLAKVAVETATTPAGVQAASDDGLEALSAI